MQGAAACVVVGAGPAGLAAAVAAAAGGSGRRVLVLEKNDRPGRKLLLTGGGRCNVWDPERPALEALEGFGRPGLFLRQALAALDWRAFLEGLGVGVERDGGAVFVRGGARAMLEALLGRAGELGAEIRPGAAVRSVGARDGGGFEVTVAGGERLDCERLILAAGGLVRPDTGSSGDAYAWARTLGHEVDPPRPALSALVTDPCFPELAGVSLERAEVSFPAGGKRRCRTAGGLVFTHRGLSGPAALNASLELARLDAETAARAAGNLNVDLAPDLSQAELVAELVARARAETKRSLATAGLGELVPSRLLAALAESAGLAPRRRLGSISHREHGRLAAAIKGLSLKLAVGFAAEESMITVGGVATAGIDPRTMESRSVPGLHFAGELLAPAGPCGGYNLLEAFATGTAAGPGTAGD